MKNVKTFSRIKTLENDLKIFQDKKKKKQDQENRHYAPAEIFGFTSKT